MASSIAIRIGRPLAIAWLLLAAWDPPLPIGRAAVHVTLVVDQSASMDRAWLSGAWPRLQATIADLPDESRVSLLRFGAEPVVEWNQRTATKAAVEPLPVSSTLQTTATDISAALRSASQLRDPVRDNLTVLLSDGAHNGSADLALSQPAGPDPDPLLWWAPLEAGTGEAVITALHVPATLPPGVMLPVQVETQGATPDARLLISIGRAEPTRFALPVDSSGRLSTELPSPGQGLHHIDVRLQRGEQQLDRRVTSTEVAGTARVLVISQSGPAATLSRSLRAGGWPVTLRTPGQLTGDMLNMNDVAVLDGIAVSDLPASIWTLIEREVTQRGLGLVVLGGPGTFAAGDYLGSTLETLLPVTAEPPRPIPSAAVLFVVDESGSMGRPGAAAQASSLALARQAVIETASALRPRDTLGVVTFAAEPRWRVPLQSQASGLVQLEQEWTLTAQGGTRLAPALGLGFDALVGEVAGVRLLIAVTDGIVDNPDALLSSLADLADERVALVVLAVGANADAEIFARLADSGLAKVLQAGHGGELPGLMRRSVAESRDLIVKGRVIPELVRPLPLFAEGQPASWPAVRGYVLSKPRKDADVYLDAGNGDPLLAAWRAGTGQVIALPAGLEGWANDWVAWDQWGEFAGGLVQWAASGRAQELFFSRDARHTEPVFTFEAVAADGSWLVEPPQLTLLGPGGAAVDYELLIEAPGRYRVRPKHYRDGRYDIHARIGGAAGHYAYHYESIVETGTHRPVSTALLEAVNDGRIASWKPDAPLPIPTAQTHLRGLWIVLAMLTYLVTLLAERGLHELILERLKGSRSRRQ